MTCLRLYEATLAKHGFNLVNTVGKTSCYVKVVDTNEYDINVSEDGCGLWAADWTDACGTTENTLKQFLEQIDG